MCRSGWVGGWVVFTLDGVVVGEDVDGEDGQVGLVREETLLLLGLGGWVGGTAGVEQASVEGEDLTGFVA